MLADGAVLDIAVNTSRIVFNLATWTQAEAALDSISGRTGAQSWASGHKCTLACSAGGAGVAGQTVGYSTRFTDSIGVEEASRALADAVDNHEGCRADTGFTTSGQCEAGGATETNSAGLALGTVGNVTADAGTLVLDGASGATTGRIGNGVSVVITGASSIGESVKGIKAAAAEVIGCTVITEGNIAQIANSTVFHGV